MAAAAGALFGPNDPIWLDLFGPGDAPQQHAAGPRVLEALYYTGCSNFLNPAELQQASKGTTAPLEHRVQRAHRGNCPFGIGLN